MKLMGSALAIASLVIGLTCSTPRAAESDWPGERDSPLEGATARVYKSIGDVELLIHVFKPEGHTASDRRPAIVFFFGGGWRNGNPKQFENQARYFASRGMMAFSADYRVKSRQGTTPIESVADAKSAVRWVRANAARLGVDPDRIVASGGSAGGHVAACTGVVSGFDETSEDAAISSVPNAMILFNPAVDTVAIPPRYGFGENARAASPVHNVKSGAPPTLVLHGKDDTTVPHAHAASFAEAMTQAGNRCELASYEGQGHGFFNFNREGGRYAETVREADGFLASLGYLTGEPTID